MKTILLLLASNIFMTFAWYGHLKNMQHKPLYMAILVSWGLAFFDYLYAGLCMVGAAYFMFRDSL